MKVVYIAGPYRGPHAWAIEENIRQAERLSLEVWKLGCAAVCPHTNTRYFQGALADEVWLRGDLAIVSRCDAMILTEDWERSEGARAERDFALERGIPVFHTLRQLDEWNWRMPDAVERLTA